MRAPLATLLVCAAGAAAVGCARPLRVREVAPPEAVPPGASVVVLSTRAERRELDRGYRMIDGVLRGPQGWAYRPEPEDQLEYTLELREGERTPRGGVVVHRLGVPELAAGGALVSTSAVVAIVLNVRCPPGTIESIHENEAACAWASIFIGAGVGGAGIGLIAAGLRGALHDPAADPKPTSAMRPILAPLVLRGGGGALIGGRF